MSALKRVVNPLLLKRFQYVSDLHIDRNGFPRIKPIAPNLLIGGDLVNGWKGTRAEEFLKGLCSNYEKVMMVPGNHEYYGAKSKEEGLDALRETEARIKNLYVLDNQRMTADGVMVMGTTLWSHIPEEHYEYYQNRHTDYKNIPFLTPSLVNQMHRQAIKGIRQTWYDNPYPQNPFIILTHHAPLIEGTCLSWFWRTPDRSKYYNHAYCSDLSKKVLTKFEANQCFWVFGHSHYRTQFKRYGTHFFSNPLAFPEMPKTLDSPKVPDKTLVFIPDSENQTEKENEDNNEDEEDNDDEEDPEEYENNEEYGYYEEDGFP